MPFDIASFGLNAANTALGTAMGLALEKHNDRRQISQQDKLNALQIKGQKEMTDYNFAKELEMWKATNYSGQLEEIKKAGLNPALLYGMSGGGGVTTGSPSGNVSGAQAPSGGQEVLGMTNLAMQKQMMQAQIDLAQSQANKNNVEAEVAGGAGKENIEMQTKSLAQGIENQKTVQELNKIQTELARVDLGFNRASYDDRLEYIQEEAREMTGRATQALVQGNVDTKTEQTKINTIKAEYIQRLLENAYITAQTKGEYQAIDESKARTLLAGKNFEKIAQEIVNTGESPGSGINNEKRFLDILQKSVDFQTDPSNLIMKGLLGGVSNIMQSGAAGAPVSNPIRGFHTRQ